MPALEKPRPKFRCASCRTVAGCSKHGIFCCETCQRPTRWSDGAADDRPGDCSECWSAWFEPPAARPNRWNTIGRTRRKLAEILTAQVRSIEAGGGGLAFPDAAVAPEDIHAMRLVGSVRAWEDAHSWEAYAKWPDGTVCYSFFSYDNMTACVRAGRLHTIGKDGEVSV